MTNAQATRTAWVLWVRWLIATALGWVAGVFGAIILSELVVNLFYHEETNLIVGLCMGAAMGAFQVLAVRPSFSLPRRWIFGGALIMAPPFIAYVGFEELSFDMNALWVRVLLGFIAVAGGLAGALVQARTLRPYTARAGWWVAALAISWALTISSDRLVGFMGAGVVLAVVSGSLFVWLLSDRWRTS